jgi:hypothetical protein
VIEITNLQRLVLLAGNLARLVCRHLRIVPAVKIHFFDKTKFVFNCVAVYITDVSILSNEEYGVNC